MEALTIWLEDTWLSSFVGATSWAWPAAETLHFFGVSLLVGVIGILDLRMLGMAKGLSIAATERLVPWGALGFGLCVVSGSAFVAGDPSRFVPSALFQFKLALIVLAGVNVLVFYASLHARSLEWSPEADVPGSAKVIAVVSLVLWTAIVLIGRYMAFV